VLFVPQDRIAYLSEVFFNEEFPTWPAATVCRGSRRSTACVRSMPTFLFQATGPIPDDPKQTRAPRRARQILVDARDGIQTRLRAGATEDQASRQSSSISTPRCMQFMGQREVRSPRIYR
jgi:hypothetical protein